MWEIEEIRELKEIIALMPVKAEFTEDSFILNDGEFTATIRKDGDKITFNFNGMVLEFSDIQEFKGAALISMLEIQLERLFKGV